jgi:hypothetical protein
VEIATKDKPMDAYRHGLGENLTPLTREFFATFSRFEFALKRGGFLTGQIGQAAGPDWDRFANALPKHFIERMREASGAGVFFAERPQKLLVLAKGEVAFKKQPDVTNSQQLFEALRLVRNNLFHGEKPYVSDRDEVLMKASLFVLDSAFAEASVAQDLKVVTMAFAYAGIQHP